VNSQQELLDAINTISQNREKSFDTPATVLRVEGETVWVHIDGGADETPVLKTVNCAEGDTVQVRISNGSAFIVGNASAPPTDDSAANAAHFVAENAEAVAAEAKEDVVVLEKVVDDECIFKGDSNIKHLSSTMYQNANGVNIYNDTLTVGDSYAHIDGDSFDIKEVTSAGTIDDANDTILASFGREITIGSRINNQIIGDYSQVIGYQCVADGDYAQAFGYESWAYGNYSHATGYQTKVYGDYSYAEGYKSRVPALGGVNAVAAHAEGYATEAGERFSHAEGCGSSASGQASHAEGEFSIASGHFSHAQNWHTTAASYCQTAIGSNNVADTNNTYLFIIGNGSDEFNLSNALAVDWNGNVRIAGEVQDMSGNNKYSGGGTSVSVVGENLIFSSGAYVSGENLVIS
jgi:antitoxin component of MazEF toxin-antitoxin module